MTLAREMALESEYVMGTFARKPVEFVEGHGMTLIDDAGNEYLDFLSGIGVCSLGHCHPSIVQAVSDHPREQLLLHRAPRGSGPAAVEHAERLRR